MPLHEGGLRMERTTSGDGRERLVQVSAGPVTLEGSLSAPERARAVVLFAHGSGSSLLSSRNRSLARGLHEAGTGTLLFDLLTPEEADLDARKAAFRFDVGRLAERLVGATDWLGRDRQLGSLPLGYFGEGTGAGAALMAAAERPDAVGAVVSRGGR